MLDRKDEGINILGKLRDKTLEHEYEQQGLLRFKGFTSFLLNGLGLSNTAFIIFQILTADSNAVMFYFYVSRIIILTTFAAFSLIITMTKRATVYKAVLAVFEFIFPASYIYGSVITHD